MTGGSINKNIRGFGVAVGHEAAELSAKIAELREEEEDLAAAERRHRAVSEGLREDRTAADSKITTLELKLADCGRKLDKIAADEIEAARLLEETERDAKENAAKVAALEAEIDDVSTEIEGLNARIAEIRAVLDEEEFNLLTDQLQRAQKDLANAERRLETKTNALNDVLLERRHFKQNVEERTAERTTIEERNAELDAEIAACNADIEKAKAALAAYEDQ
mgnify:FL=1